MDGDRRGVAEIEDAAARKREILRALAEVTERFVEAAETAEEGEAAGYLEKRQNLFADLQRIDAFLDGARAAWPRVAPELAPDARRRVEAIGADSRREATRLAEADWKLREVLEGRREAVFRALERLRDGREAMRGYRPFRAGTGSRLRRDV